MDGVLSEIISLLTGGITGIATGIGEGLGNLVKSIFLDTSTDDVTKLSVFGTVVICFAGVSLAIGLSKLVVHWITSLGASRGM